MRNVARLTRRTLVLGGALLAACSAAFAADSKPGPNGALVAALVLLGITPVVQVIAASLAPTLTRRAQRALALAYWPATGWGALVLVLGAIVAAVLSKGGKPGQVVASAAAIGILALSLAGGAGMAKAIGDWVFRRWGMDSLGPLSVLIGAPLWALGAAVPIVGWIAGLFTLVASLGAACLIFLQPRRFAEPPFEEPPSEEPPLPEVPPPAPEVQPPPPVMLALEPPPTAPGVESGIE